jgi:hypothetical protein
MWAESTVFGVPGKAADGAFATLTVDEEWIGHDTDVVTPAVRTLGG